jgi:iron complex outermembrane recepter protein
MVRARRIRLAALPLLLAAAPAAAGGRQLFAIPAGSLEQALLAGAAQAHVDVGIGDPGLRRLRVPALQGRMSTSAMFAKLLAGSPYVAHEIRPGSFRIEPRRVVARPKPAPRFAPSPAPGGEAEAPDAEILVTASKRGASLSALPGAALVIPLDTARGYRPPDLSAVAEGQPVMQTTALGPGRDKLFVRGIADSSFAGPTQTTVATYFGDARLTYNGADPSLRLYDMERVEILEGPQGTLYGAGAIGGIVRLIPHAPDVTRLDASAEGGVTLTEQAKPGYDLAGMVNLPVAHDLLAVRLVGYGQHDTGYIDDSGRAVTDVNDVYKAGGRIALAFQPGGGWRFDAGVVGQHIAMADQQYGVIGLPTLTRASAIAQPSHDDFILGYATLGYRSSGGLNGLASLSIADRDASFRYDATPASIHAPSVAYDETGHARLYVGELRLWRSAANGSSWLVGASVTRNEDAQRRRYGLLSSPRDLIGAANRTTEIAGFGEATLALSPAFSITAGGRITSARMDGAPIATPSASQFFNGRSSTRVDPSLGFFLRVAPWLGWYGRFGQGFRTGGLAVASRGRTATYESDTIIVGESGLRFGDPAKTPLSGHAALSWARWQNIQADLVGGNGFPFTANIGNGRIAGLELQLDWRPIPSLHASAAAFLDHNKLTDPAPGFTASNGSGLPDTPKASASGSLAWDGTLFAQGDLRLELAARYIGRSLLGLGPQFAIPQGDYAALDVGGSLSLARGTVSLRVANLTNTRGNRFAFGNPFDLGRDRLYTPLRPRSVRLGYAIALRD